MPNVKLTIAPLNYTNDIIMVWAKNSAPLAEVGRHLFEAPHSQRNYTIEDLQDVVYKVAFYETLDGTTLNTLISTIDIDASVIGEQSVEFYEYTVDGAGDYDPVSEQDELIDPNLYLQVYTVEKRGFGKLKSTEYTDNPLGGFTLVDDTFYPGDIWFVTVYKRVASTTPASGNVFVEDVLELTDETTTISSTHYNKKCSFKSATNKATAEFPSLATIDDGKRFFFDTHQGSQVYGRLQFAPGQGLIHDGATKNKFDLAPGEEISIIIKNAKAYVLWYSGNERTRGRVVFDHQERPGHIIADGTEYDGTVYVGLWEEIIAMNANATTDYATWAASTTVDSKVVYPNKGQFAVDLVNTKFKVPDLRNQFIRALKMDTDAERLVNEPGGFQIEKFKSHKHGLDVPPNASAGGLNPYMRGNDSGDAETKAAGGTETRPDNIGLIPLIVL